MSSQLIEIRGKIASKLKFWGQLGVKLKRFAANDEFTKGDELWGPNWLKSGVKLKEIESLMVNRGSNCINPRSMTKLKNALQLEADLKFSRGKIALNQKFEENWKFNDQSKVKLHKSKTKDQTEKYVVIRGWFWNSIGAKLH